MPQAQLAGALCDIGDGQMPALQVYMSFRILGSGGRKEHVFDAHISLYCMQ